MRFAANHRRFRVQTPNRSGCLRASVAHFCFEYLVPVEDLLPLFESVAARGWSLLAFHALAVYASFAFVLMHKVRARVLATTDPLTGAYNRRMFEELAERELSRARRGRTSLSLLALDLDRFKRFNDTYGHAAGDKVLASFAALVRKCLRKEDLLARYGGEEFVVMLPGAEQPAAAALGERIRRELEHTRIHAAGHDVRITVSVAWQANVARPFPRSTRCCAVPMMHFMQRNPKEEIG